ARSCSAPAWARTSPPLLGNPGPFGRVIRESKQPTKSRFQPFARLARLPHLRRGLEGEVLIGEEGRACAGPGRGSLRGRDAAGERARLTHGPERAAGGTSARIGPAGRIRRTSPDSCNDQPA